MRLGLFGGSFNPPHVAHLAVAEACAAGLDRVLWMPAPDPPHKAPLSVSGADRLALVRLAIAGNARFEASDLEFRRPGPHYTVDTLRALRAEHPDLALVIGGDSLAAFSTWREPDAILELARLVVYRRPGSDFDGVPAHVMARTTVVEGPGLDLSATELRARLAAGLSARYLVPDEVLGYIAAHGLYRGSSAGPAEGHGEP